MTAVERVFSLAELPPEEDPNAETSRDEVMVNKATSLKGNFFTSSKSSHESETESESECESETDRSHQPL